MDLNIPPSQDDPAITEQEARRASMSSRQLIDESGAGIAESQPLPINPLTTDPMTELTEEDLFRMKGLTGSTPSEMANQSAVSVADSTSNIANDVQYDDVDTVEGDEASEESKQPPSDSSLQRPQTHSTCVTCGDYVFGRNRPKDPNLNAETVTELKFPFEPLVQPGIDEANEYRRCVSESKVYLVGTAHFSQDSKRDVLHTIQTVQPDIVMVELCSSRISILSMDEETLLREAKSLNREKIMSIVRNNGLVQGMLHVLLLSTSAHITRELGMAPGGEFRAAHMGSLQVQNCRLVLGDRPLQITLQRALSSLNVWQKLRLFFQVLIANRTPITQEDVERCKNKDLLEELLKEMAGEFPQLSKIFVDERDQYMTHILHSLLQRTAAEKWNASRVANAPCEPTNIVAVVGIGHVSGIVGYWNRHIDSVSLLTVQHPSRSAKIAKFMVKAAFYGAVLYGGYKISRFAWQKVAFHRPRW